ncbi:MAG: DUF3365 domain-containing protein, partial [Acidobacteriota bacterium]
VAEARKTADGLMQSVRGVLVELVKDGKFAEAADACSTMAQDMTKNYAESKEIEVYRVSLKYRNAMNRPDKLEKRQLKNFDKQAAENTLVKDYYEVVKSGNNRELLYMKPLIVQGMCLKCHGSESEIPADVKKIFAVNYPKDKAIGYKVGDVRGAITVRMPLK